MSEGSIQGPAAGELRSLASASSVTLIDSTREGERRHATVATGIPRGSGR